MPRQLPLGHAQRIRVAASRDLRNENNGDFRLGLRSPPFLGDLNLYEYLGAFGIRGITALPLCALTVLVDGYCH
jgi:hypothetical protein